jgi:hypothetical protein
VVGNELEQEIISLYAKDISSLYSINQIAHKLKKKYPYINKKVSQLIEDEIFTKTIAGRSYLCSLNLRNDETLYLLILREIKNKKVALKKNPLLFEFSDYLTKISRVINISVAIESRGKITFVFEKKDDINLFEKAFLKETAKGYSIECADKQCFLQELLDNQELQQSHTILHGYERYYECLREIEDKLKLKYSKLTP